MSEKQAVTDDKLVANVLRNDPLVQIKVLETSTYVKLAVTHNKLGTDALIKRPFVQTQKNRNIHVRRLAFLDDKCINKQPTSTYQHGCHIDILKTSSS